MDAWDKGSQVAWDNIGLCKFGSEEAKVFPHMVYVYVG